MRSQRTRYVKSSNIPLQNHVLYIQCLLLINCVDILIPSITKLANSSEAEGVFPKKFKKGFVTPLIRKHHVKVKI